MRFLIMLCIFLVAALSASAQLLGVAPNPRPGNPIYLAGGMSCDPTPPCRPAPSPSVWCSWFGWGCNPPECRSDEITLTWDHPGFEDGRSGFTLLYRPAGEVDWVPASDILCRSGADLPCPDSINTSECVRHPGQLVQFGVQAWSRGSDGVRRQSLGTAVAVDPWTGSTEFCGAL